MSAWLTFSLTFTKYQDHIEHFLTNYTECSLGASEHYGETVEKILYRAVLNLLIDLIHPEYSSSLVIKIFEELNYSKTPSSELFREINHIFSFIAQKCHILMESGVVNKFIKDELKLYREIFSDLIPFLLLEVDVVNSDLASNDFSESIYVSEGIRGARSEEMIYRSAVLYELKRPETVVEEAGGSISSDIFYKKRQKNHEQFEYLNNLRIQYAKKCKQKIEMHISAPERKQSVKELKKLYDLFCGEKYEPQNSSGDEIYKTILDKIKVLKDYYKKQVRLDRKALERTNSKKNVHNKN